MTRTHGYVPALGYDALTALYDPVVAMTTRERTFKRALIGQARIAERDRVLDLACGTGTLALWIKREHPTTHVTGIDGDPRVLSRARAKAAAAGVAIRFERGCPTTCPIRTGRSTGCSRASSFTISRPPTSAGPRTRSFACCGPAASSMWRTGASRPTP